MGKNVRRTGMVKTSGVRLHDTKASSDDQTSDATATCCIRGDVVKIHAVNLRQVLYSPYCVHKCRIRPGSWIFGPDLASLGRAVLALTTGTDRLGAFARVRGGIPVALWGSSSSHSPLERIHVL